MAGGLFSNGTGPSVVDVAAFFDSGVSNGVAELVSMGVLVAIGTTRDRGAVSITVTNDGNFDREYFRDSAEATDYLRGAATSLRAMGIGDTDAARPAVQTPPRRRQKLT